MISDRKSDPWQQKDGISWLKVSRFGKWLRRRRRELDLTQEELAYHVGCAPITIHRLEGEAMCPSKQLAEACG